MSARTHARRRTLCALGAAGVCALLAPAAYAHRLAPAFLELVEQGGGRVEVLFKLPVEVPAGADLRPELPPSCAAQGEPVWTQEGTALVARWSEVCAAPGLVGARIGISGLAGSGSNALLRVQLADGRSLRAVLHAGAPAYTVPERESRLDVARDYLRLGAQHIVTGLDHLLFVFGLVLLVRGRRALLYTVTAFTLGHSVTLSLAALGFVHFPTRWIETVIAGTILWLAAELARPAAETASAVRRRPWRMAGAFGLLHGLSFASALAEVGLPDSEIPLALLSFNAGIEVGQLAFVAVLLFTGWLAAVPIARAPGWLARAPVTAMGTLAAYWCFERGAAALGL